MHARMHAHTHARPHNALCAGNDPRNAAPTDPHRWFGRMAQRLLGCARASEKQASILGSMGAGLAALDTMNMESAVAAPIVDDRASLLSVLERARPPSQPSFILEVAGEIVTESSEAMQKGQMDTLQVDACVDLSPGSAGPGSPVPHSSRSASPGNGTTFLTVLEESAQGPQMDVALPALQYLAPIAGVRLSCVTASCPKVVLTGYPKPGPGGWGSSARGCVGWLSTRWVGWGGEFNNCERWGACSGCHCDDVPILELPHPLASSPRGWCLVFFFGVGGRR